MKTINFSETLAFGIVGPTTDLHTTSFVQESFDVRMKEGFTFGKAHVPERFSSTVFLGEGTFRRKNYRSDIRCKIGSKPKVFSESCFVTPKRADKIFKSEVRPLLPSSKQTTVNRWFSSSVSMVAREFNCGLESIQIEQPFQSVEMVLTSCPDKLFADPAVVKKGCDFNQNIATSSTSAKDVFWKNYNRYCTQNCNMLHVKCRNGVYPRSNVERQNVPDDKVLWSVPYPEYSPPNHTDKSVFGKEWADIDMEKEGDPKTVLWNAVDPVLKVDRSSFLGNYSFFDNGLPKNPMGRTGLTGRGLLGKWGPNHAGDPIVTRWKRNEHNDKVIHKSSGKPILQFVSIQRRDNNEWAIPGGMVDPGEMITETLRREFAEEAMNLLEKSDAEKQNSLGRLNEAFRKGDEIYKGYVDDPRNTDNAWMETVAFNFHDENGTIFTMKFHSGDDAVGVTWMDIDGSMELYASHKSFIEKVVHKRGGHW